MNVEVLKDEETSALIFEIVVDIAESSAESSRPPGAVILSIACTRLLIVYASEKAPTRKTISPRLDVEKLRDPVSDLTVGTIHPRPSVPGVPS